MRVPAQSQANRLPEANDGSDIRKILVEKSILLTHPLYETHPRTADLYVVERGIEPPRGLMV
jgi:hypothetical protein